LLTRSGLSQLTLLCCMAPALLIPKTLAQTPTQEPVPTIKSETRAVVVDVVVTKGADEPVTGLHKEDFAITENGSQQSIVFFEEHKGTAAQPADLPPMPPNVFTNVPVVPPGDSLNVLLIDGLNTPRWDQSSVREQVIAFLKSMPQGTPLAVFTLGSSLRLIQGFIGDRASLLASLQDKKSGVWPQTTEVSRTGHDDADDADHLATMAMMKHAASDIEATGRLQEGFKSYEGGQRAEMTAEALQNLARYLAKIPGRKNLIWFATNFPIGFFPNTSSASVTIPVRQNVGTGEMAKKASLSGPTSAAPQSVRMKETTDLLTVSRVAIYPIGAQGAEYPESQRDGTSAMFSANGNPEQQAESAANHVAMSELASETGGEAIYNNNDFSGIITRVIQNGSHYYTLSYTPNKNMEGQFHSIQVKLAERGYKLSYRHGYYALDEIIPQPSPKSSGQSKSSAVSKASLDASPSSSPNPLQPLMERGTPSSTQIIYAVRVEPANPQPAANAERAGANAKLANPFTRYTVDFLIQSRDLHLEAASDGNRHGQVQVELLAYDRNGKALNWTGNTANFNLKPATFASIEKSGLRAHMEIDIPQGEAWLATGVYDWKTGKAGTLEIPLNSAKTETAAK
jgi:VWFA-related protein